ncbi:putative leucine-rich repeat-containing protein DDB_G0290503 isoform X2 [Momordica charantia]|uniref:Leucine-rich repeat-containing protein DDB_G0290503 isoform X2 n=1 Tax=Momordica charantia TaxID=3673 RepID=A0A6J1CI75_MOMCH|nr:putative leucine-rich repeat-containing protein DDB_G0290503 isoform X2 [Momordica charantia]
MSRIAKWKLEKTKVKVVFRLQFHATHIPQFGWDKLFISFIPADSGKATAKTTKANVRNGACKWADPIYETARLLQDTRTKKYDDKLYKLVVAMGSSRSSILGEANINLADYADALKPSAVALPLNGCEAGTILHVTVQLLTSKTGFREFEQQRELRERGLQTFSDQNSHGESPSGKVSLSDDKVNARIRSKEVRKELPLLDNEVGRKEEYADSATGFDGSSNTSESLYAEKHDVHEVDSIKSTVSGDLGGLSIGQSLESEKGDQGDHQYPVQGSNNWAHNWGSDYAADSDLIAAYKENSRLGESLEVAESSIVELKLEVSSLQNHVDEMGVETQKIAWQVATETASGKELTEEVSVLKSECLNLKEELERLKNLQSSLTESRKVILEADQASLCQKLEPQWLKGLLTMEEKIRDLLNKSQFGCQDRDVRFLLADLEGLLCFLQDIREQMQQAISCDNANQNDIRKLNSPTSQILASGTGFDSDIYHTESMLHCLIPGLVSYEPNSVDAISSMKGKIFELLRELDESKAKQEGLAQKMDQMECYYEAFIQELEENQRHVIGELQNLRNEHATCIYTVTASKDEIEALHHEMNNHLMKFAEDKKHLDSINKELERRASSAETALKRARLNYSIAVNQLQKDLDLLSGQVTSMFETNENLIKHALAGSSLPSSQEYCEIGWNPKVELEEFPAGKLLQCQNHDAGVKKYHLSGGIFSEDLKRSLYLQEGLYQKVEDEVFELHLSNIYLDVFSKTLHETLLEASTGFKLMKERMNEISQQLELSTKSKESLLLELQASLEEIQSLNEYKTAIVAKYNEMALKTEILEENLLNVTRENSLLTKRITECEALVTEYRSFEMKYQTCHMEKLELENSMMEENIENKNIRNEISSLHEELKALRVEFDNLFSEKEELHNTVDFVQDKLSKLLASCRKNSNNFSLFGESVYNDSESDSLAGLVLQFENLHLNACKKLLQLMDENKHLMEERDMAQKSLTRVASDNLIMKENFGSARQDMVNRLDKANGLVQKFQIAIETVSESINSSEAGDKFTQQHKELLSVLDHVEDELQQLTSKNNGLENEMMALRLVNEELETCKFTIEVLTKEKQDLLESLHEKVEESMELKSELGRLEEKSQSLSNELDIEQSFRDVLENRIKDLDAQIKEKSCKLLDFEKMKAEAGSLKQLVLDLESEKSRVHKRLIQSEELLMHFDQKSSSLVCLESQLSEMHEFSIAADISLVFTRSQYQDQLENFVHQFLLSERDFISLQEKYLNVETALNHCQASEACQVEENARLLMSLNSLKAEIEAFASENKMLLDANEKIMTRSEELQSQTKILEAAADADRSQHAREVEKLGKELMTCETEIDDLLLCKEELEVSLLVVRSKLDEQHAHVILLQGMSDEIVILQNRCNELNQRLSEQILKTEEFKNLSTHLKDLKDRADAECLQLREKKENEGPSNAMQESLRIAFIKEQYETKLQELKHQLSVSKKHSEEMLWKLQDAINEVETRKKSEVSHIKRNEELGKKILELEGNLNAALSEKRELTKAYDLVKAEKECSSISLECCKEEKHDLEASLKKCNDDRFKITMELNLMKDLLESYKFQTSMHKEGSDGKYSEDHMSKSSDQDNAAPCEEVECTRSVSADETHNSHAFLNGQGQPEQDVLMSRSVNGLQNISPGDQEVVLHDETKHLALVNDNFRAQSLKFSMDHLNEELERLKNENSLNEDHPSDSDLPGLEHHLMRLHKANEVLGSIFPLFKEFSGSGNALERVLALEIELAEALQGKKKSNFQRLFEVELF